jgi:hypothetical protein
MTWIPRPSVRIRGFSANSFIGRKSTMMCRASSFIASPRERPGFGRRRAPGATDGHDCTGPVADPPAAARATALVRPFRLHSLHATGDAAERRDRLDLDPNDREVGHPDGGKQRGHSLPM